MKKKMLGLLCVSFVGITCLCSPLLAGKGKKKEKEKKETLFEYAFDSTFEPGLQPQVQQHQGSLPSNTTPVYVYGNLLDSNSATLNEVDDRNPDHQRRPSLLRRAANSVLGRLIPGTNHQYRYFMDGNGGRSSSS